ncbi:MAG TPA: IgGFc-binding protein [Polyangiaceae bacterium]|nr:IgGFc-binding protein [Polyangiaceae bacterium]
MPAWKFSRGASAVRAALLGAAFSACAVGCSFDRGDRWVAPETAPLSCLPDLARCTSGVLERCVAEFTGNHWQREEDCQSEGLLCSAPLSKCVKCMPNLGVCDGQDVLRCNAQGSKTSYEKTCDGDAGYGCLGGECAHLCTLARDQRSNVGCEYWAVDLDNAMIDESKNAAAQQFAVVVSNPQDGLPASVQIQIDDGLPGDPTNPTLIAEAKIAPFGLQTFLLGPREVDGSPAGQYNTGTNTALTRHAFRITTSVPVVAYQFNPLDNVGVFSNDASLLKPVEAMGASARVENHYVALGWPQTIASTSDPETNFDPSNPHADLRAFLTIVGTRQTTKIRVTPSTRVVAGGSVPEIAAKDTYETTLNPFDVLNLETGDFNADFTGSLIDSDGPVIAFSGSEASDAPWFRHLAERQCCADHLEEQLDPIRTAGKRFVAPVEFNRSLALAGAGATLGVAPEPEFFRIIATAAGETHVTTTLPDFERLTLAGEGDFVELKSTQDLLIESDEPVMLGNVTASQQAAGIPARLPGGDPSFLIIPPVEQYRSSYVFLTPDRYAFDFLRVVAPLDAAIRLDSQPIEDIPGCLAQDSNGLGQTLTGAAAKEFTVYRCQLTFPVIDPLKDPDKALSPGDQTADGVHTLLSNKPVGVIVDGFDVNVSYGYAGGTQLTEIVPR